MLDLAAAFGASGDMPVTIVVANRPFLKLVQRWSLHARTAGCEHYRIVCMDDGLLSDLRAAGEGARILRLRDLLPDIPAVDCSAPDDPLERLQSLTVLRVKLFRRLVEAGCDFVHSDADAFWLRDPRPCLQRHPKFDLLFSQGTVHPRATLQAYGFTICPGFFLARANARTRRYFAQVDGLSEWRRSDQERMNAVLTDDPSGRWEVDGAQLSVRKRRPGAANRRWIRLRPRFLEVGVARALHARALGRWPQLALQAVGWNGMVTSEQVIAGRFSEGLTVGVIPMRLVERVRFAPLANVLVSHVAENKAGLPAAVHWDHLSAAAAARSGE